ncbi:DMT family transporter [Taklimakanibacter lacteus]|uniref:DMT family transporter n=1 Tax=Taklimakanibacter lacteus TaxID=2268456 RepID=UPI000E661A0D
MNSEANGRRDNVPLGIVVIVLTVFAMASADAVIKYVSATFTLWQIYVVRSLIVMPMIMALMTLGPRQAFAARAIFGWPFLRGLMLAFMYVAIYAAMPVLSLATIAASLYTAPLFIAVLSPLLMGEKVGLWRWAAVVLGFLGVLTILRPGADSFSLLALIPVVAAVLYALAAIVTRTKCATAPPAVLALALNLALLLVGVLATAFLAIWHPGGSRTSHYPFLFGHWTAMGLREYGIIAILACLMVAISLGLAKAYQSAPPSVIATFDYSYLLFSVFWGFILFGDVPDVPAVAGMLMIAAAGLVVIRQQGQPRGRSFQPGSQVP